MIIISDKLTGLSCQLEGKFKRTPTKRGYSEKMSNEGEMLGESIRAVIDLSLTIEKISQTDYDNLEKIFLTGNSRLDITDDSRAVEYNNYYIQGESFSLEEKEDYDTKTYYYTGGLIIKKR